MDINPQLRDRTVARGGSEPIDPYEMGRVVTQLAHNTAAVHDLAKAVQRQTDAVFDVQRNVSELKDGLKHANNDIRILTEKAVTMDAVAAELRKMGLDPMDAEKHRANQEFLTRRRHTLEEQNSTKRHVRNVVAAAVALAIGAWMWNAALDKLEDTVRSVEVRNAK